MPRHCPGRKPNVTYAFGWFEDTGNGETGILKAVCTFGKLVSPSLCRGICGQQDASRVTGLNRLCEDKIMPDLRLFYC